jgi:hypothetical protein
MQMAIGPAHCGLNHLVQRRQRDRVRHHDTAPDGGPDVGQFNLQLEQLAGLARGVFQGGHAKSPVA